jgi:hypothetical protein
MIGIDVEKHMTRGSPYKAQTVVRAAFLWALVLLPGAALAQQNAGSSGDAEWPCAQRRVPTVAVGTVWTGPDPAQAGSWGGDFEAAALAQKLASRRTPLAEIDPLLDAFAEKAGAEKAVRLTRVFAGVHELINTDRDRVMSGIDRYARGQQRLAERVREEADQVSAATDAPDAGRPATELETRFAWDRRIFEDRSQALTYVCEVPVLLEQRLFDLARRIEARL